LPNLTAEHIREIATGLVDRMMAGGATESEVIAIWSESRSARVRNGEVEEISGADEFDLGLRAICGGRQAVISTSRADQTSLDDLVARVLAMARAAPEDPYAGLPDASELSKLSADDLDLYDDKRIEPEELVTRAKCAEAAAKAIEGVTNSEGSGASAGSGQVVLTNSAGFSGSYKSSMHGISATAVAGSGTGMERDYDYAGSRHFADLPPPDEVGRLAGERATRRLDPRKPRSGAFPVIFHPRVARTLIGHFAGAVNGESVARGTSFLRNSLGKQIFSDSVSVIDDPLRPRGLGSRPFDGEGARPQAIKLIEDGTLNSWLLDSATAKRLKMQTNGHASRSPTAPPSPTSTNLYLVAGEVEAAQLIGSVSAGLYVCELIGMGVNLVTGDYSRGAAGFWIEDGEVAYPVSELTIAGNLRDMFANLEPASDLEFRYATNAPTVLIHEMTIAGQ